MAIQNYEVRTALTYRVLQCGKEFAREYLYPLRGSFLFECERIKRRHQVRANRLSRRKRLIAAAFQTIPLCRLLLIMTGGLYYVV